MSREQKELELLADVQTIKFISLHMQDLAQSPSRLSDEQIYAIINILDAISMRMELRGV